LLNIFQNSFNSNKEVVPPEELELELFLKELQPCQTSSYLMSNSALYICAQLVIGIAVLNFD
jgi:hypothetical protein